MKQETEDNLAKLRDEVKRLRTALEKIIEMNRQNALDQYGDAEKAESWACVTVAKAALEGEENQTEDREDLGKDS